MRYLGQGRRLVLGPYFGWRSLIMDKGLNEAISVLELWAKEVFNVLLDTVFLPFRFIGGLLA